MNFTKEQSEYLEGFDFKKDKMKTQFLNNHPILEKKLLNTEDDPGVNLDHVIIDKEDWIEAIRILDTIRESPKVLDFMDDVSTKKILDAITSFILYRNLFIKIIVFICIIIMYKYS